MYWVVTQASSPSTFDDPITWVNFGVLGLLVGMLLTGYLWAKPSVSRVLADNERVTKQRDDLIKLLTEEVTPVLVAGVKATETLKPVLDEVVRVLQSFEYEPVRRPTPRRKTTT